MSADVLSLADNPVITCYLACW